MKRHEIILEVEELVAALAAPLPELELANGWSAACQTATRSLLQGIAEDLRTRKRIPHMTIGRGLDHWGVEGGPLFERACVISNHLREIVD
ncbi:MAG: hypothetical protein NTW19_03670 [Planctomycetota bacterium]|nr:hypothetical protein [Planctomycetota bacterium]